MVSTSNRCPLCRLVINIPGIPTVTAGGGGDAPGAGGEVVHVDAEPDASAAPGPAADAAPGPAADAAPAAGPGADGDVPMHHGPGVANGTVIGNE